MECNALDSVALHCDVSVPSDGVHIRQAAACNLLVRTCKGLHGKRLRCLD